MLNNFLRRLNLGFQFAALFSQRCLSESGATASHPVTRCEDPEMHITFNDGCMIRLSEFLRDAAAEEEYKFLDKDRRDAAIKAIGLGIDSQANARPVANNLRHQFERY